MSNVITFVGTVGKDATTNLTQQGSTVLNVLVANNTGFGDRQQTHWFNVVLFGKRAEGKLVNYLKKGQSVFVSGELNPRDYQHNGQNRTSLGIIATTIELVGASPRKSHDDQDLPPVEYYDNGY